MKSEKYKKSVPLLASTIICPFKLSISKLTVFVMVAVNDSVLAHAPTPITANTILILTIVAINLFRSFINYSFVLLFGFLYVFSPSFSAGQYLALRQNRPLLFCAFYIPIIPPPPCTFVKRIWAILEN